MTLAAESPKPVEAMPPSTTLVSTQNTTAQTAQSPLPTAVPGHAFQPWTNLPQMPLRLGSERAFLNAWFNSIVSNDKKEQQQQQQDSNTDSGSLEQSEAELVKRISAFHDRALAVVDYPCIRRYAFVRPNVTQHPRFVDLFKIANGNNNNNTSSSKNESTTAIDIAKIRVLDLGCCMGTELRSLIVAGADPRNLRGVELIADFIRLGHEFFETSKILSPALQKDVGSIFLTGNILEPGFFTGPGHGKFDADNSSSGDVSFSSSFNKKDLIHSSSYLCDSGVLARRETWPEAFDVVYNGSMLHLFSLPEQRKFLDVAWKALRPGGYILGRTTGLPQAARSRGRIGGGEVDLHSVESLRQLLIEVFGDSDVGVNQVQRTDDETAGMLKAMQELLPVGESSSSVPDTTASLAGDQGHSIEEDKLKGYRQRIFLVFWARKSL